MDTTQDKRMGSRGRPVNTELSPAIMEAVLSLLAEQGYAQLTTAAVAKRAGVSTATLYRRWPSKRELLLTAAQQIADSEVVDINTGTLEGDLNELFAHKRQILSGPIGATMVALMGESAHDTELAEIVRSSALDSTCDHLNIIFDHARSRGELVKTDTEAASHLIIGAILARIAFSTAKAADELLPENDVALLIRAIISSNEETTA